MNLHSVNVSPIRVVSLEGREVWTGIFKQPVEGRVRVRRLGLFGDIQADRRHHGGLEKAVYAYPFEHYASWREELGEARDFPPGQFGENLTVTGMLEEEVCIGDVYRVGEALLQVSEPRQPCFKLGIKMGRPDILRPFVQTGRVGFYLRVLEEGSVGAGDPIHLVERDPVGFSVRAMSDLVLLNVGDLASAERALRIESLSPYLRNGLSQRLLQPSAENS
ncbi:MAG: MOSC domain-containing protein [Candidatus Omnitrophica bacterium]|nr:MOSC domain-containing protein [Candidatus Omnitrophota bacterium]